MTDNAAKPFRNVGVPLDPEHYQALINMAAEDFRRPAQMAAKLLTRAIDDATTVKPARAHRKKAVTVEQTDSISGSATQVTAQSSTDPWSKIPGAAPVGGFDTVRYAAGGVVTAAPAASGVVQDLTLDEGPVITTTPSPVAADEPDNSVPDRPDLRAPGHGYGQRIIQDIPQA